MAAIRILAASSYAATATEQPADLKSLLRDEGGPKLRRSNRFTELALLGAMRCSRAVGQLPRECGLYLASGQGNVVDTVSLLEQIVRERLEPMPLSFINVSSNMAGFAVAQALGLQGRNCAVSRNGGAFDSALELALLDLQAGAVPMALVGVVEECAWPLAEHRRRLGLGEGTALAEQSSWLLLAAEDSPGLASVAARRIASAEELTLEPGVRHLPGPLLPAQVREKIAAHASPAEPGYSESIVAHHLVEAIAAGEEGRVCYLNGDGVGGIIVFEFS